MSKFIVRVTNDEFALPRYVECGLGFAGVRLTEDINKARRYETADDAEKAAKTARAQKAREHGGEQSLVEVIEDAPETPEEIAEAAEEKKQGSRWHPSEPDSSFNDLNWATRMSFKWGNDSSIEFQIARCDDRLLYRYVDHTGKPHKVSDKWVAAIDAFFSFVRYHVFDMFIDFEGKQK